MKQRNKRNPLSVIHLMLDTFARMIIVVTVMYILGLKITPTPFQVFVISFSMCYFTIIPLINYVKEAFFRNGR